MNRLSKLFSYTVIAVFAGMFFSCSNLLEQNVSGMQSEAQAKAAYLKVSVGSRVARTVMPSFDENNFNFTDLVLKGTKAGGEEQTLGTWESVSAMQDAVIPVTSGFWTFTLTAKNGGTSLSGTLQKSITLGENELNFTLSISDIGNADGSFSITLNFAEADNADKVTKAVATLENTDGSAVSGTVPQTFTPTENAVTFSATGIAAGTYRAKVVFYATENGTDFELATYRELVQISSDLASSANRTIENFDNLYTVTYNLNGGTLSEGVSLQETVTRKSDAITLPLLTRDYYNFDGWYADENFAEGTEVTSIENFTANVNVYAKFTPITYTITYELNGGTNADGAVTSYTVEDDVTLPTPEKGDEAFGGWFESEDFSTTKYKNWSAGTKNGNKTLYAKYDGVKVTAENIVEKIKAMTASGTLKASGEFNDTLIDQINLALIRLGNVRPDVLVSLDLEDVTGMSVLEYNWTSTHTNDKEAFYKCKNLENIILPDTLIKIGYDAFYECSGLTSITIPDSVTSIGGSAFENCTGLTSITIPDSVTSIGGSAFRGCSGLTEITIPLGGGILSSIYSASSVFGYIFGYTTDTGVEGTVYQSTYIGDINVRKSDSKDCYYYIPSSLKKVTITGQNIPSKAFYNCSMIEEIVIDNATVIGSEAFRNCTGLTEITIPDSVTSIGSSTFGGCTGLTSITIPYGVTSFGNYTFGGCTGLTSITIPDGVTSLGSAAFSGCTGLKEITIPDSVTDIGDSTFFGCTGLTSITIPDGVKSIGGSAFKNCTGLTSITIPDSVTSIGSSTFGGCTGLTAITIPDSVTSIGDNAFYGCSGLTSITIPDGVKSIGYYAFYGCSGLTSITIPDSVTSIGGSAFENCTGLTSITIPDSVTSIGGSAFYNCTRLTSITIPDSVTSIGEYAFSGCTGFTEITIPTNVVKIGRNAFGDCTKLRSITFANRNGWYRTTSPSYKEGNSTNLSNQSTNATYFKTTYVTYYWYRK